MKNLPDNIQKITDAINETDRLKNEYKSLLNQKSDEWFKLYQERQKQCNHIYADGTSAWRHNYAYSNCDICGYSDL